MVARHFAAALAAAALLAPAAPGAAAAKPKTHTITIVDSMTYEPARLTVRPGDTVIWVNKDVVQHTATAANGAFNSPAIGPGATWKLTLRKRGAFGYTCRYHPMMKGLLEIK